MCTRAALIALLFLCACHHKISDEEVMRTARSRCDAMGYEAGSRPYSDCLLQMDIAIRQDDTQEHGNRIAAYMATRPIR